MKKITFALLIMAIAVFAETNGLNAKAYAAVDSYNSIVKEGSSNNKKTMCYVRNGLYTTYQGKNYVIEVNYYTCHWYSKYFGGGETKCLSYGRAYRSTQLCDCDLYGELSCI